MENTRTSFKGGETPDISHILIFYWFEPVLYSDPVSKFSAITERPGYPVGFANNAGDTLTFQILKNDLSTVLRSSVVRNQVVKKCSVHYMMPLCLKDKRMGKI